MPPIDASIPLQVQPSKMMSPGDLISLQNVSRQGQLQQVQLEEAQQGQEKKNMLRQAMQGATDPATGRLTPQGLAQITQIDPAMGLQLGHQQEQLRLQDIAVNQKKDDLRKHVGTSYVTAYDRYLQQTGGNAQQAQQMAQKDTLSAIDEMEKNGTLAQVGLDSKSVQGLKTLPPPETMRATVIGLGGQLPDKGPTQRSERKRISGDQEIQEEFDPVSRSWSEIGRGPRFAKSVPAINLNQPTVGDFTKTGDDFLNSVPAGIRGTVKKLASYDIDPKTLSAVGGHREQMLALTSQFDPTYDQKNYNAISQAVNKFATGPQGNTVRSLNVALEHMDTARKLGDALKNTDTPLFNKIANEFATMTGKPAPTSFNAVKEIVADEVVKGVIGGAGALQDREAAAKKIRDSSSPAQMNAVFDSWTELLGGQLKGLERQYQGATQRKDFREKYLTPRALQAFDKGKEGVSPASAPSDKGGWKIERVGG